MHLKRICASLLLATMAMVVVATPALAHTSLESSNPAEGASLAVVPTEIQLTFGEAVTLPADPVTVTGPSGEQWTAGKATVADAVVTVPVQPAGPAGAYTIAYKVISDDGDPVTGAVHFTLTAAATPSTAAPSSSTTATSPETSASAPVTTTSAAQGDNSSGSGGVPAWVWILIVVVVIAVIIGVVVVRRSRASSDAGKD
jgi:methionine-rich copper-binding protein CopC